MTRTRVQKREAGASVIDRRAACSRERGISTLTLTDLAASKLLANSDRQADDGVFSRDLLDLAMMALPLPQMRAALHKAEQAYGAAVTRDLAKALARLQTREGWLERCMQAMSMNMPKAVLWQKIRRLKRLLPEADAAA